MVVAAGDVISLNRQRVLAIVWGAMLVAPPVITVLVIMLVPPVTGRPFAVTEPANAIGRYFSDAFQRRTGRPLEIAAGEPRLAALVALTSRPRASLYLDATPERSPWVNAQDVQRRGAVVVWGATDTAGAPPPEIKARFPGSRPRTFPARSTGSPSAAGRAADRMGDPEASNQKSVISRFDLSSDH